MDEECPQIVIIGGGPVGLFTAVQIKILVPTINLVIYEKYKEYQRKHVLRLNKVTTFFSFPPHPLLTSLIDNLPSIVRTSVLESQLLELTKKLQIPIIYKNVTNLNEFSNVHIIIGADGSHSIIRQLVFNNQINFEKVLKYVVEIKYEIYGKGQKLDYIRYQYRTQKQLKYIVDEHIGSQKDNRTSITLHLLINEKIYEDMKSTTFKQPYYLYSHKHLIPNHLLDSIMIWLNAKQEYANERRVENSEKITCIALSVYESAKFVYYDEDKQQYTCLVGDAAFGVPFFRSLNNGIICSRKLALCIQLCYDNDSSQTEGAYNQFVHTLAKKEIILAHNKANFLFAADMINKVNGAVPWQVNKWSDSEVEYLKQQINDNDGSIITPDDAIHSNAIDDENHDLVQEFDLIPSTVIKDRRQD